MKSIDIEHMFVEHLFCFKRRSGTSAYQASVVLAGLLLATALLVAGCLPDAHRLQGARLAGQLGEAQRALRRDGAAPEAACAETRDVSVRLRGEPGLTGLGDAWTQLTRSADALLAACGQLQLLALPAAPTLATLQARARWQEGVHRELTLACTALRAATVALGSAPPACD